jgi:hypothetical protein
MWIYWFQSVTIGVINFLEILNLKSFSTKNFKLNGKSVEPNEKTKKSVASFFLLHYGFFHFIYAIFVFAMPASLSSEEATNFIKNFSGSGKFFFWAIVIMFILNQFFYYKQNKDKIKPDVNIGTLMFFPYARIIPMHLCIIFSFVFSYFGKFIGLGIGTKLLLVFFLMLKTFADMIMQWIEMKKLRIVTS